MIQQLGDKLSDWSERYMPDPFIFALVLTLVTLVIGVAFGEKVADKPLLDRFAWLLYHTDAEGNAHGWVQMFYSEPWMKFAMQMCIVLITGHALANSRPVRRGIEWVADVGDTPGVAVVLVSLVACGASLLHWGLGAIAGAFMAREVGRAFAEKEIAVHYPLLGAAGYAGFLVWHGGFSGSAPLKVKESGHIGQAVLGYAPENVPAWVPDQIPITETLFSPLNLLLVGLTLVLIPLLFWALMPDAESEMSIRDPGVENESDESAEAGIGASPAVELLEGSRLLNVVSVVVIGAGLGLFFLHNGIEGWGLDTVNLLFLGLGILAHPSPRSYVDAVVEGTKGAAGIILQFPFYFGILGLLKASGLIHQIAAFFVSISSATTFPVFAFLSAGIVNFFVPSGGGQWAVQGQVVIEAAHNLGVDLRTAIVAFSWGDAWTNMLQPFWALPLLGIMDLEARDIIGYTALVMFVTGPVIMGLLLVM